MSFATKPSARCDASGSGKKETTTSGWGSQKHEKKKEGGFGITISFDVAVKDASGLQINEGFQDVGAQAMNQFDWHRGTLTVVINIAEETLNSAAAVLFDEENGVLRIHAAGVVVRAYVLVIKLHDVGVVNVG